MKRMAFVLFLAAVVQPAAAGVYKWVDEEGRVHYGQRPPAVADQAEKMKLDKAPPPDPYAAERRERMQRYIEAKDEERAEREKKKEEAQAKAEERKQECTRARKRMALFSGGRIYEIDENGQRSYMDDKQRAVEKKQAQAELDKWCR